MGLPSGQAVARHLGLPVIQDENLSVGKASADPDDQKADITLSQVSGKLKNNAPLWQYVLAEGYEEFDRETIRRLRLDRWAGASSAKCSSA